MVSLSTNHLIQPETENHLFSRMRSFAGSSCKALFQKIDSKYFLCAVKNLHVKRNITYLARAVKFGAYDYLFYPISTSAYLITNGISKVLSVVSSSIMFARIFQKVPMGRFEGALGYFASSLGLITSTLSIGVALRQNLECLHMQKWLDDQVKAAGDNTDAWKNFLEKVTTYQSHQSQAMKEAIERARSRAVKKGLSGQNVDEIVQGLFHKHMAIILSPQGWQRLCQARVMLLNGAEIFEVRDLLIKASLHAKNQLWRNKAKIFGHLLLLTAIIVHLIFPAGAVVFWILFAAGFCLVYLAENEQVKVWLQKILEKKHFSSSYPQEAEKMFDLSFYAKKG